MTKIVVIGGGPGGVAASIRATQLGAEVSLVEAADFGGVCMNRGCIPLQVLGSTALGLSQAAKLAEFNLSLEPPRADQEALFKRLSQTVAYLRMGTQALLGSNGVKLIKGRARLSAPDRVEVNDQSLEAEAVILAAGGGWLPPQVPGADLDGVINTDQLFAAAQTPARALILGGPAWAVELAQYLSLLGTEVVLAVEGAFLPEMDRQVSNRLKSTLEKGDLTILPKAGLKSIEAAGSGLKVNLAVKDREQSLETGTVIYTQRGPATAELGLEALGLEFNDSGLVVDEGLRTSIPSIFALGDITGGWMVSHRSSSQGLVAAENALGGHRIWQEELAPTALFTAPQAAAVGLSEKAAKAAGQEVVSGEIPYGVNARALVDLAPEGFVKLVCRAGDHLVLGVHIFGSGAVEMIGQGCLALALGATARDLARITAPHPSFSESLADAARSALDGAIYAPKQSGA